jgi:formylmethanofuran dehydrogenase subunit E-like metal-binding protein
MKIAFGVIMAAFLLSGCSSIDKYKDEPADILHRADIDADNVVEIIKVKDKFDTQSKTIIIAMERNKAEIDSFSVPGRLQKIEFMRLDISPRENISAHYKKKDGSEVVDIYGLKDGKFRKVFTMDSNCGIETDYSSVLARIKVGKFKCDGDICSCIGPSAGDMWIWGGDRFVKER